MKKLFSFSLLMLIVFTFGCKKTSETPQTEPETKITEKQNVTDFLNLSAKDVFTNNQGQLTSITEVSSKFKVNIEGAASLKTFFVTAKTGNVNNDEIIVLANVDKTNDLIDGNMVNKLINNEQTDYNGLVIHKNAQNKYQYEAVYKDGQITETRYLEAKPVKGHEINYRCTAYYLVVYVNGVPVSATWLYTLCSDSGSGCEETRFIANNKFPLTSNCNEGGGGGGNGGQCNPSLISPGEEDFNNFIINQTTPETKLASVSTPNPDPVIGTTTWIVTEGQIASWKVEAITEYKYYHSTYMNMINNTIEHSYNLFHYKTIASSYIGSNTFITTTWIHTNANSSTMDQVTNNNAPNCKGVSNVIGTLRHVANYNWPVPLPYCPKVLDNTDAVNNIMTFYPR